MKHAIIAAVLILAGAAVAQLHSETQDYYPVVKIVEPHGASYTAVMDPVHERPACGEASKLFLEPVKAQCPQCQIVWARCERELNGLELAVFMGEPVEHPVVSMHGLKVAITASEETARAACTLIAGDIVRSGQRASCIFPRSASGGSTR
jgi:hypothetical protein